MSDKFDKLIDQFAKLAEKPHETAKEWSKKTGRKVVAVAGLDVPEPVIEAAGMMPLVLLEDNSKPISLANSHVQTHMCGYMRSMIEQVLDGSLDYVEALVMKDCCHEIRMLGDLIHYISDRVKTFFIYFPPTQHETLTHDYMVGAMKKYIAYIEDLSGKKISDEDLAKAIAVYNENRKAMVELYDIRMKNPGIISGVACSKIVQASMCMPKEEHTKLVKELIAELNEMAKDFTPSKKTKLIVSGSLCESCKDYVLNAVESCGGVIVYDDLYVGSRYFNTLYKEELGPMEALIDNYVNPVSPCATKYEKRSIGDYQLELLEKTGAAGIIDVIVQNCEAHYYGYFMAHRKLTRAGKRDIELFVDMENNQEGQVKTRLQSFIESLEA
ncbi:MAG: 2-hydroxyacyl-CoA dehydratase family protein [Bacillota bacterium]|nr:2-hydroxyacyl-CoA dehydratase family protein [Bacillota bacterium]